MARVISQSDRTSRKLRNFFLPLPSELAIYILVSAILIIMFNTSTILNRLGNDYLGAARNAKASMAALGSGFSTYFSSALNGRLGQMVLWAFIGALVYIGLWLSRNVLTSFENDIIIDHYLHPKSFSRAGYFGSSLSVKLFLAAGAVITATYAFLLTTSIFPSIARLSASAAYNFVGHTSPIYLIICLVIGTVGLYVLVILFRLIVHLWRLL